MRDPARVWAEQYRILTTTRCIPHFDDTGHLTVEPLTHEEATVLASALTVHLIDHYTEKATP